MCGVRPSGISGGAAIRWCAPESRCGAELVQDRKGSRQGPPAAFIPRRRRRSEPMTCAVRALQALPKPAAVSVNGVVIPRDAIAREVQNHPASKPIKAWESAARALAIRELLLQQARLVGIIAAPVRDGAGRCETEEEALIRGL